MNKKRWALCDGCTRVAQNCFLGYGSRVGVRMASLGTGGRLPSTFKARALTMPYGCRSMDRAKEKPSHMCQRVIRATLSRCRDLVLGLVAAVPCDEAPHCNDRRLMRLEHCVAVLPSAGVAPVPGRGTQSLAGRRPRPATGRAAAAPCTPCRCAAPSDRPTAGCGAWSAPSRASPCLAAPATRAGLTASHNMDRRCAQTG